MAVDRLQWRGPWFELPHWKCPSCGDGLLLRIKNQPRMKISTGLSSQEEWEPGHGGVTSLFSQFLRCSRASCQQVVVVSGTSSPEQMINMSEDGEQEEWVDFYDVTSINPAPIPILLVDEVPGPISHLVANAAGLYWLDAEAAANKLRQALEALMDHFQVPSGRPLHDRLVSFKATNSASADLLLAVKWLGNAGSHTGGLSREDVLDGFDILERALAELFDRRGSDIAALAARINQNKGPLPR